MLVLERHRLILEQISVAHTHWTFYIRAYIVPAPSLANNDCINLTNSSNSQKRLVTVSLLLLVIAFDFWGGETRLVDTLSMEQSLYREISDVLSIDTD